ncbi:MAG: SprB repeat-containing protein, partial [Saprospiraceae bacterium]|nr:SprB repeat-containing protein [Saprospiraceae bacterium]
MSRNFLQVLVPAATPQSSWSKALLVSVCAVFLTTAQAQAPREISAEMCSMALIKKAKPGGSTAVNDPWAEFVNAKDKAGAQADLSCSCPNNLIQNNSFESGTANWTSWGGNFQTGTYAAVCGANSGQMNITSSWGGVYQDITTLMPGDIISVGAYAGTHDPAGYYVAFGVEFYKSNWTYLSGQELEVNTLLANMGTYEFTVTVPANAAYVRIVGKGNGNWLKLDGVCVTVVCNNATNGGTIATNQTGCVATGGSFNPALITNAGAPTGGTGALEIIWIKSTSNCPPAAFDGTQWTTISGATSLTYDPGPITQTTCYRRCARRAGCTEYDAESNIVTMTVNTSPNASISGGTATVCSGVNTTLTASGGGTYAWSTGSTTAATTVAPTTTTTYTVTVTAANGCTKTATKTVTVDVPPASISGTSTICPGTSTTLTASGGGTYSWNTGFTTAAITVNPASTTTYTVTVTSAAGCTKTATQTVTVAAFAYSVSPIAVTTSGGSDGKITVDVTSGNVPNYSYNWTKLGGGSGSGSSITAEPFNITGLLAGEYNLTVTNGSGCTQTAYVEVPQPPSGATDCPDNLLSNWSFETGTTSSWTCAVGNCYTGTTYAVDGTYNAYVQYTGGSTAEMYQTVNGIIPGSTYVLNFWGGTHQPAYSHTARLTFYNASGGLVGDFVSSEVDQDVDVSPYVLANYTLTAVAPAGASYVRVRFRATGDYLKLDAVCFTGPCTASVTDIFFNDMVGSGDIAITNGGKYPLSSVSSNFNLEANTAGTAGSVKFTITGAQAGSAIENAAPWNYPASGTAWTPVAGTYTVNVKVYSQDDAGGTLCDEATFTFTLCNTVASISGTSTICSGQSTTLTASGGVSYVWNTGGTSNTLTVNPTTTTTYTVTATDSYGCTASATKTITVNSLPNAAISGASAICTGTSTVLTASGGGTYAWNTGLSTTSITVNPTTATTYTVTVTSANGCTKTATKTVTVNSLPPAAISGPGEICLGASATLTASGGGTYAWNTGLTTAAISVSPAITTTYTVTVTSAAGCTKTATKTVIVNSLPDPAISGPSATCAGTTITLTASGGGTYSWSTGVTTTSINVTPVSSTSYTVTVTNSKNCTDTAVKSVTVNPLPNAAISGPSAICSGSSATLTASGGGTYAWNTGSSLASITVNPVANTTYTVTVTGANGCTKTATATVAVNGLPTLSTVPTNSTCGQANGSINLTVSGGTNPYAYAWTGGSTIQDPTGLAAGTYTVTVTDANGCTKTTSATVNNTNGPSLSTSVVNVLCNGASTGSIDLVVTGGTSPFTYDWSNDGAETPDNDPQDLSSLAAGAYTVTVTDANGCTATTSATISQPTAITASATSTPVTCNGGANGTITLTVSGGTPGYTYVWTGGSTSQNLSGLAAGTYTVTVTDANGCTKTTSATVAQPTAITASATATPVSCN